MGRCSAFSSMSPEGICTGGLKEMQEIKGVFFPSKLGLRRLVVTGPPGSGKSTLMSRIGGWPQEGYVDLSQPNWWRAAELNYRPREVHLGFPFKGVKGALAVFDDMWLTNFDALEVDLERIQIPPIHKWFWSPDWKSRYVFEFILPSPENLFQKRKERALNGTHLVDHDFTLEQIMCQVAIFRGVALHLHRSGIKVYVREGYSTNLSCFRMPMYEHFLVDQEQAEEGWCEQNSEKRVHH